MSHRRIVTTRPLLVAAMVLALLAPAGVSALQQDGGLIDSMSYRSPQFGYTVTWSGSWSARDRDVISNPGGFDTVTLNGDDGAVRLSGRSDDYSPLTFLQDTIAIQLASGGQVIAQDTTGEVPTAGMQIGRDRMRLAVVSLPDAGAIVLTTLRADQRDYEAALGSARENIQLNGNGLFGGAGVTPAATGMATAPAIGTAMATEAPSATATATSTGVTAPRLPAATPDATPRDTGVEGNSWTSPQFGFSVSWDSAVWSVPDDAVYRDDGVDNLTLESPGGPIYITGVVDYNGDASTCLLGEVSYYRSVDNITEYQPAVDADGNELDGETETSAWGVYTNVYADPDNPDQETHYVDYIECQELGDDAVAIFYSFALREDYNDHIANVLAVTESLDLPDNAATPVGETTPEAGEATVPPVPDELPATPVSSDNGGGDVIAGQSYPYSFTVPTGWQVDDSQLGGEVEATTLTNGTSTVTVAAQAMEVSDPSECVIAVVQEEKTAGTYGDLALAQTANGDPFRGSDDFSAFANLTYTGPDGETWSHFVECQPLVAGHSMLVLTQDVPRDLFASERAARLQIENSIEIGP